MISDRETAYTSRFSMLQRYEKNVEPKRLSGSQDNEENVVGCHGFVLVFAVGQLALFWARITL